MKEVTSQEEEDQIAKAIALSLSDSQPSKSSSALYPSTGGAAASASYSVLNGSGGHRKTEPTTVVALYDFEAAEENEISFREGDTLFLLDDSNANWWRGRNQRTGGEGLFPSSFVSANHSEYAQLLKKETVVAPSPAPVPVVEIDENQLMKCIALLEDCDPTGVVADPPELVTTEAAALAQAPLIDSKLTSVDRQSNQLAQIDMALRDVLALYDNAVQHATYQVPARYSQPAAPLQGLPQGVYNPVPQGAYQQHPGMQQQPFHNQQRPPAEWSSLQPFQQPPHQQPPMQMQSQPY